MSGGSFSSNFSHSQSLSNNERSERIQYYARIYGEGTVSNRTGPLLSENSQRMQNISMERNAVMDPLPANLSNDPHLYLQWR
jgi:hypothetical protein